MEDVKLEFPSLPQCKEDAEEWTYPMRREMQEILPGLFLGPYSSAMKSKLPILQKHGITHIICIRQNIEANFIKPNFQQLFRYLVLDIADNPVENIIRFFPMTKEFIDESLQSGGKVLVHGNAGISRSAAFVIAYIMETFGMKYRDAFAYVQERRFCINPNAGFVHQLQFYVTSSSYIGEGNGTPLQYSCLENPMDGGAWWAAVHGVTKSWTRLSDFTFTFLFMHWRRKWQPTPVFLLGESQGRRSLVGCHL